MHSYSLSITMNQCTMQYLFLKNYSKICVCLPLCFTGCISWLQKQSHDLNWCDHIQYFIPILKYNFANLLEVSKNSYPLNKIKLISNDSKFNENLNLKLSISLIFYFSYFTYFFNFYLFVYYYFYYILLLYYFLL